jgi:hypothetical protein
MSDSYSTKDIVERLDQLIAIMKLSNAEKLNQYKTEIEKDDISQAILDLVSDEPLDYSTLVEKAAEKTGKSERSARRRIADMSNKKILVKKREGGKTLYFNSGILE